MRAMSQTDDHTAKATLRSRFETETSSMHDLFSGSHVSDSHLRHRQSSETPILPLITS